MVSGDNHLGVGRAAGLGLLALLAGGPWLGSWVVQSQLASTAAQTLASSGIQAEVRLSGRDVVVTAPDAATAESARRLLAGVPGIGSLDIQVAARAVPSTATSPSPTPGGAAGSGTAASGSSTAAPSPSVASASSTAAPSPSAASPSTASPSTPAPTTAAATSSEPAAPFVPPTVLFEGGTADPPADVDAQLAPLVAFLQANPGATVTVRGHTDTGLTAEERAALSQGGRTRSSTGSSPWAWTPLA